MRGSWWISLFLFVWCACVKRATGRLRDQDAGGELETRALVEQEFTGAGLHDSARAGATEECATGVSRALGQGMRGRACE